ncbi:Splicing factor U2AF 50 kDa subunit [Camellia lanceoleosa]|uniref:Splicing factor U2AF 50 kDa subunit n=1 Tax=Camellia lanceoleosa TaxID=1840588 RepID=A0ACC0GXS9_9ERIC|nr:Splicing factor U2AF 50 kDa subunit [Camellia lanceoleosa]
MSRSSRHKERHGSRSELSQDKYEGTAARIRPLSFDEIMLRRKNKKQSGDVEAMPGEAENITVKDVVEKVFDRSESVRGYRNKNDSLSVVVKHSSEDFVKVSSRKKEDNTFMSEDKLVKRKDKEIRDSKTKSKATLNKDAGDKAKGDKDDRRGHGRRKNDEWLGGDSENESDKRRARDLVAKERHADRSRGKSEKEIKRKRRDEDDERSREKNSVKKHVSGKRHDLEFSDRKERKVPSKFHNEESRLKKRRSRSRERDKDKGRRSLSLSPRSHKRTSYNMREHGELFSHSSKDRSRRQQSDDDRNKISSNGSSSHYQRHGESTSGLGGYSPRKRRSEVVVKSPPPHWSPEKKSAGWDLPPAKADINATGSVLPNVQSLNQTALTANTYELSTVAPVSSTTVRALSGVFSNAAFDSIQLTQATRPMRRLYIENLPASASEKAVMECLNNFLLPSGVNRVKGTLPCISCIIHKEKGQALVEFLTPEDASAALSLDGRSFFGSFLKIRRPKDYVEVATGAPDKSVAAVDSISDIVRDSPHKIFVGGISKAISSEMLMEIASAFGPLKAFHFEVNVDINEPCAFLEYVDQSVTIKACTGLNGMRLGGRMLTVVLATLDASSAENVGNSPFYGIPEHVKPLLEKPTQVLKLRNVLDPEALSSLSEPELEEILEDIRIECARFGIVKSVNVVKCDDCDTIPEKCEVSDDTGSGGKGPDLNCTEHTRTVISGEPIDCDSQEISRSEPVNIAKEPEVVDKAIEVDDICGDKPTADLMEDEMCEPAQLDSKEALEDSACEDNSNAISLELNDQLNLNDQMECHDGDNADDNILTRDAEMENESMVQEKLKSEEANGKQQETSAEMNCSVRMDSDNHEKNGNRERVFDLEDVFEPGCILVEYGRTETASVAAHCLNGRLFDNRVVTVGYVAYDIYRKSISIIVVGTIGRPQVRCMLLESTVVIDQTGVEDEEGVFGARVCHLAVEWHQNFIPQQCLRQSNLCSFQSPSSTCCP